MYIQLSTCKSNCLLQVLTWMSSRYFTHNVSKSKFLIFLLYQTCLSQPSPSQLKVSPCSVQKSWSYRWILSVSQHTANSPEKSFRNVSKNFTPTHHLSYHHHLSWGSLHGPITGLSSSILAPVWSQSNQNDWFKSSQLISFLSSKLCVFPSNSYKKLKFLD